MVICYLKLCRSLECDWYDDFHLFKVAYCFLRIIQILTMDYRQINPYCCQCFNTEIVKLSDTTYNAINASTLKKSPWELYSMVQPSGAQWLIG